MRIKNLVMMMVASCAVSPGLTACVVVPFPVVPEEDLFAEERVQFIEPGKTSRDQIQEKLGAAALSRMNGDLAVYGQARTVGRVFAGTLIGTGGVAPIEKYSTLIVQYDDDDTVTRADILRGAEECTEDGLCIEAQFDWQDTGKLMEHESVLRQAVVLSSGADDHLAKQFATTTEGCRIYIYSTGADEILMASSPAIGRAAVTQRGYLSWENEPGLVEIHAWRWDDWTEIRIDCAPRGLHFVNLHLKSRYGHEPPEILSGDETGGKAEIMARSLILH
jgi:hypothetical protein